MVAFYRQLLERVNALQGVVSSSASTGMPVSGVNFGMDFNIVGREVAELSLRPGSRFNMATAGYFSTFGIRITRGRAFTETDTAGAMPVAIVNEELARKYLSDVDPLTQRVSVSQIVPGMAKLGPMVNWQIVGVYQNVRTPDPKDGQRPEIIVPFAQSPWPEVRVAVRTFGDPANMTNSIAAVVRSLDSDLPMVDVKTMDRLLDESMGGDRFGAVLFGIFAAIALLLAAFGIYGVMSFAVAQRTHEIGLRMALGAGSGQVLKMILKEGLALGAIGVLIGLAGAWAVGRIMQRLLYGIGAVDYSAFSVVAAILMCCAFLACYVPASRATQVDPLTALRDE
jgi:putative ABC transport system permease protein